jgi:hypothetical protein
LSKATAAIAVAITELGNPWLDVPTEQIPVLSLEGDKTWDVSRDKGYTRSASPRSPTGRPKQ